MGIKFEFLEAGYGDSILISTDDGTNILIDGGLVPTYKVIKKRVNKLKKKNELDLVVLTHIDNDHICGLISLIREKNKIKINKLWFNSANLKVSKESSEKAGGQAIHFEKLIKNNGIIYSNNIYLENKNKSYCINKDIELKLLSPIKEDVKELNKNWKNEDEVHCNGIKVEKNSQLSIDTREIEKVEQDFSIELKDLENKEITQNDTPENQSSIAFILKYQDKEFLFLADANIGIINQSLRRLGYSKNNPLKVEFVKLSHHGSKNNINHEFLKLVDTEKYITLTNGNKFKHPSKETLSLIIMKHHFANKSLSLYFNYKDFFKKKFMDGEDENDVAIMWSERRIDTKFSEIEKKYNFKAIYNSIMEY